MDTNTAAAPSPNPCHHHPVQLRHRDRPPPRTRLPYPPRYHDGRRRVGGAHLSGGDADGGHQGAASGPVRGGKRWRGGGRQGGRRVQVHRAGALRDGGVSDAWVAGWDLQRLAPRLLQPHVELCVRDTYLAYYSVVHSTRLLVPWYNEK